MILIGDPERYFKSIKNSLFGICFFFSFLAIYTKTTNNNIVDNLIAGNEFERVEKLYIPKKVLNKTDQTIETDLGRLKITDIKILKRFLTIQMEHVKTQLL